MTENFPNVTECGTRPGYDTDDPTTINCKIHSECEKTFAPAQGYGMCPHKVSAIKKKVSAMHH